MGSQYEFLKNYDSCIEFFKKAIWILEQRFEPDYALTLEFKKGLDGAIQKYSKFLKWKGDKRRTFTNLNSSIVNQQSE